MVVVLLELSLQVCDVVPTPISSMSSDIMSNLQLPVIGAVEHKWNKSKKKEKKRKSFCNGLDNENKP